MSRLKDEFYGAMEDADKDGNFMFWNKEYNIHRGLESHDPGEYGDE
jgi:hypothetical protein